MQASRLALSALFLGAAAMTGSAQAQNDRMMDGFTAEELLDSAVYGQDGNRAGTVESIVIDSDGMIDRVIVQSGGFLDIGDYVLSVDFDDIDLTPGREGVRAPIEDDNLEDFSLFGDERARLSEGAFRASEILDDEVRLANGQDGEEFGYVTDLRFSSDGELQSIIYQPDITFGDYEGYYEADWYGYDSDYWYDYDPGLDYYGVDYGIDDIGDDEVFDYDGYYDGWL